MTPALGTLAARQELPATPLSRGNTGGFDAALTDLASSSGAAITRSTAKVLDYPASPAAQNGDFQAIRAPLVLALAIILAATVGMIPTADERPAEGTSTVTTRVERRAHDLVHPDRNAP